MQSGFRARARKPEEWKGETMTENTTGTTDRVKGKNVYGQVVVLTRSKPEQLGLFQTFLPEEEEKYSNTIELYDAVPKYFSHSRGMAALRESGKYLPILERAFEHRGEGYKVQIHPARIRYKDKRAAIVQPVPSIHFSGCWLAVNLQDGWNPWCQKEQILYTEFMH